jgi:hypothetical protein
MSEYTDLGAVKMSSETDQLFSALSGAQAAYEAVIKDSGVNMSREGKPGAKYNYAKLENVQEALKKPFGDHGLSYSQWLLSTGIQTIIQHKSGQWISGILYDADIQMRGHGPQDYGSFTTYLRRYHLAAATGISQEDDDGIRAQDASKKSANVPTSTPQAGNRVPQGRSGDPVGGKQQTQTRPPEFPEDEPPSSETHSLPKEPPKNETPVTMNEASQVYEKASKSRGWDKSKVDLACLNLFKVDSALKLRKWQFEKIMRDLGTPAPRTSS